jgi:hypothetical protein
MRHKGSFEKKSLLFVYHFIRKPLALDPIVTKKEGSNNNTTPLSNLLKQISNTEP